MDIAGWEKRKMKISTRTRYGLRAMADLAINYKEKPVLVKDIAKRQNISDKYLEHIMLALKKAGLVESISGARGGYLLTRDISSINALEIVNALEGSLAPVPCINHKDICKRSETCKVRTLWGRVRKSMEEILSSTTLEDLSENKKQKEFFYHI
jgi:Rrf2 family transcriptional regulator, cysteine metabolism repressor